MREDQPAQVSLPRRAYVAAAVFAVLMLGLLTVQLIMIDDQRTTTDRQLAINARQSARAIPLIDETRPLVEEAREALPAAKRLGERAQVLARAAEPVLEDLEDARIDENLQAAGTLAAALLDADVDDATRATSTLAVEVLRADLPRMAQYVNATASELLYRRRLRRLLLRSLRLAPTLQRVVPEQARAAAAVVARPAGDARDPEGGARRHPGDARGGARDRASRGEHRPEDRRQRAEPRVRFHLKLGNTRAPPPMEGPPS